MINKEDCKNLNINIIDTSNKCNDEKQTLLDKVKQLLPNIVNSDNKLNTKALQDLFDLSNTTANNQGYEITFAGKGIARAKKDIPTTKELKAELKQSKDFDKTQNVIIRGDNIDVLKILKQNYNNSIKMIYIDPPYNTKSDEFIYNDDFRKKESDLIENFGLNDETVNYLQNIYGTKSHSGWLSFIYPRLLLARDLLKDDGVIFISIDDNEQANLKLMCDEVFGEENFVAGFIRQTRKGGGSMSKYVSIDHDCVLSYAKNINNLNRLFLPYNEEYLKRYSEEDENGKYFWDTFSRNRQGSSNYYTIKCPDGTEIQNAWIFKEDKFFELLNKNEIRFKKINTSYSIQIKQRLNQNGQIARSILNDFTNNLGTEVISKLLGSNEIFSYSKPIELIKYLTTMAIGINNNDVILDFFAGSGTTAHAVMDLNKEDGGNRKFILVQLDELISEKKSKPAYDFCINEKLVDKRDGAEPYISDICIERVNRAGEKIKEEKTKDLLDNKELDIGYKVFSLTEKPKINYNEENKQFELFNKRERTIDILYNMMSANCVRLDTKIEEIEQDKVYLIDDCYYILGNCNLDKLNKSKKVYIDGYSNISLEQWLNMNSDVDIENVGVVY